MSSQTLNRSPLPIDDFLTSITETLRQSKSVIILAEPGAGKSTRVPVALMQEKTIGQKKWIMLQPRRWAARLVAERIAKENQFSIGEEVGYQVRFESQFSAKTRLIVMTEGVLLRRLLRDPELADVQGVILDEFHERSLDLDLSLALLKELQESFRPDLKIVVMSATFDPDPLLKFLPQSKKFEIPGRTFPVKKVYLGEVTLAEAVRTALTEVPTGDGLIFLPGAYEIDRGMEEVRQSHSALLKTVELLALHSSLPEKDQKRVFEGSRRKIIFATNIAETSITLPGIKWVIDTGLVKVMRNDPQFGQDRLELLRISRASSEQRAGRAGRVSEGVCYRLWSEAEHTQLRLQETPEVHRLNLSSAFLYLANYGVPDPDNLEWFERPKSSAIQFAKSELEQLEFVSSGVLTEEGKKAAHLPLSPLMAKIKISAEQEAQNLDAQSAQRVLGFAARIAVWLEEEKQSGSVQDWESLLRALNALSPRALRSATQILGGNSALPVVVFADHERYEAVLLGALKSRIFIRDRKVGRRAIQLASQRQQFADRLPQAGIILNSTEREENGSPVILVRSFLPLELERLKEFSVKKRHVDFDEPSGRVRAKEGLYFQDLALGTETDCAVLPHEAEQVLSTVLMKDPESAFKQNESFLKWKNRYDLWSKFYESAPPLPWPELVQAAVMGKTRIGEVLQFPWKAYLESTHPEFKSLDADLPEQIEVPTGNHINIDYETFPPRLAVRLQEVFGWLETPVLMKGKVPILMELLSPGFKPIQLTQDLKSFWANAYFEVRKELKARYPKHSWPDKPLEAPPVAKGRRRSPS